MRNAASISLAEALGFQRVGTTLGTLDILQPDLCSSCGSTELATRRLPVKRVHG